MKLKKEDYKKTTYPDGSVSYDYTCKGNSYHIRVVGYGVDRTMFVYKNDEYETNLQNVFSTKDNLVAWEEFERQVNECSDKPQSSGGFKKNPQANPFTLPLLAIFLDGGANRWQIDFFIQVDLGQTNAPSQQIKLLDFTLAYNEFKMPQSNAIETVDWSNYNVPDIFQSEILLKKYDKVVFEENPNAEVFLFIPKSIIPPQPPEPPQHQQPNYCQTPTHCQTPNHCGCPTHCKTPNHCGCPTHCQTHCQSCCGCPTHCQSHCQSHCCGCPTHCQNCCINPTHKPPTQQKYDLLQQVSDSVGMARQVIEPFFTRVKQGEVFLISNNWDKIKQDLQLPPNANARELAELINQQLN